MKQLLKIIFALPLWIVQRNEEIVKEYSHIKIDMFKVTVIQALAILIALLIIELGSVLSR